MENLSLREFIEKREAEIKEIRANLLKELKELKSARAAIEEAIPNATDKVKPKGGPTIKEMILSVLENRSDGATPLQIIEYIAEQYDIEIVRSSLSPQLSRLKADGKLDLDENNGIWVLPNAAGTKPKSSLSDEDLKGGDALFNVRSRSTRALPREIDDGEDLI